jgi:hypothetical protein
MCAHLSTRLQGLLNQWQTMLAVDLPPLHFVPESRERPCMSASPEGAAGTP